MLLVSTLLKRGVGAVSVFGELDVPSFSGDDWLPPNFIPLESMLGLTGRGLRLGSNLIGLSGWLGDRLDRCFVCFDKGSVR